MPWYRLDLSYSLSYSPSSSPPKEYYYFYNKISSKGEEEYRVDCLLKDLGVEEYTTGRLVPVSELPEEVRLEKINGYKNIIKNARRMIKRLEEMKEGKNA